MRKPQAFAVLTLGICLALITGCSVRSDTFGHGFSFAVVADPRGHSETWKNALIEIREQKTNPEPQFTAAELIINAGDMDPLAARYAEYQQIFSSRGNRPVFLPVIGNHEFEDGGEHFRYARDKLIPLIPGAVRRHDTSCDYYLDYRNVRLIMVDAYTDLGKYGVIGGEGRRWVEQVVASAPSSIEHIFISFHEPAFPRFRHLDNSFNRDPEQRNAFWRMLMEQGAKVRAVFVGHTHFYSRIRVRDPQGLAANDPLVFPDEPGGIYQVDAGAAGNGSLNTLVQVQISGKNVLFRTLQAKNGFRKSFSEIDRWSIVQELRSPVSDKGQ